MKRGRKLTSAQRQQLLTCYLEQGYDAAKPLAENPTLQRLRELEAVEKIAMAGKLKITLGEKGLSERVMNML